MIESEKRHKKNAISEQEIDEEVINIPRAIEVVGNLNLVKEMLKMLVDTMPEYRQTIAEMFKKKDYTAVSAVAHKLLGAACYCGTIRLEDAARNLEIVAKREEKSKIDSLVKQLYSEMDAVVKLSPKIQKIEKV